MMGKIKMTQGKTETVPLPTVLGADRPYTTVVEHQRTPCPHPLPCPICSSECDHGKQHAMQTVRDDGRGLSGVTSPLAPEGIPDRATAAFQEVVSAWGGEPWNFKRERFEHRRGFAGGASDAFDAPGAIARRWALS